MPRAPDDDDSLRAWSLENSLFSGRSGNTASTAATEHSQSSQKLQVVPEVDANEEKARAPVTVPSRIREPSRPREEPTPFAQTLPVPMSAPLRPFPAQRSNASVSMRSSPSPTNARDPKWDPRRDTKRDPKRDTTRDTKRDTTRDPTRPNPLRNSLFGDPNMNVPVVSQAQKSQIIPNTTKQVLDETAEAVSRLFNSVLGDPWPSLMVTRAATTAQRIEDCARRVEPHIESADDCESLSRIIRVVLGFQDVLLRSSSHRGSRQSLAFALEMLGIALGLVEHDSDAAMPLARNFALGGDVVHFELCDRVLEQVGQQPISDQEGTYIAPVYRGLSPKFGVATLCIGIPFINEFHWQQLNALSQGCPEVHFYMRADSILPAQQQHQQQQQQQQKPPRVVAPFRIPTNPLKPPMSISVAPQDNQRTSGTLGGYIYPVIDASNSAFSQFRDSTFALTCGHVCLADDDPQKNIDKPVLTPSPILVSLFRQALESESKSFSGGSFEGVVYSQAMEKLEKNPPKSLGPLVWGERDLVTTKLGQFMSDVAIICCDPHIKCRNDLGDDLDLSQHELGLAFDRTVTHVVRPQLLPDLEVFKYGATSRFTSGRVCASKIIYWANNHLKSSEFVVRGNSPVFASSGDSGAWVLARGTHTGTKGLGVAGMIHSFDGEFKEFGLFTPMESILERLAQVTTVPWAVVGVKS